MIITAQQIPLSSCESTHKTKALVVSHGFQQHVGYIIRYAVKFRNMEFGLVEEPAVLFYMDMNFVVEDPNLYLDPGHHRLTPANLFYQH